MASWVETFREPMSVVDQKFRKSELALMAWRSRESYYHMMSKTPQTEKAAAQQELPKRFYNEEGELDLRKMTGPEALQFFGKQGVHLPVIQR